MIKKLRIKFICVIMAIVMVLLGCILSVVIHFTGQRMEMQSINMMRAISAAPFQKGIPGKPHDDEVRLPFFSVQVSNQGTLLSVSGDYFDLSDKHYLQEIIDAALRADSETGELKDRDLRYLKSPSRRGITIVFSDTTTERATMNHLLYSSLSIFLVAMVLFLGITILLSRWVIKPVADAWDQQRQFVADASHELKTPLSVIMANAELMQSEDIQEEDRKTYSGNILNVTYQMRTLVENMLEMARVDNGAVKMHFSQLDFSQLVTDAALSFQLLYGEKGMELQCSIPDEITVTGSEQHLYQVMDILLDNGLKYAKAGSTVRVTLSRSGHGCLLSVASSGDPISKEDLRNIFKRFYRADKARSRNGSYGLGLSIAEAIVHAHKGKIWAQSDAGINTFFVQLPN